ncbi:hypothetical protein M885DRAFT_232791 [Pelagophyceae sp. CCMP2097]|nr:hypothetical protein M885DRAFT_232791 [Pelagophyceae sp. CCMP2097]|mmetsp:Transcript_24973/g.83963  ORF Transcript_24973/g.83963 Transcript_24973/m.83963 type:complete len:119 (+) Transcript_24973:1490-1846(+)
MRRRCGTSMQDGRLHCWGILKTRAGFTQSIIHSVALGGRDWGTKWIRHTIVGPVTPGETRLHGHVVLTSSEAAATYDPIGQRRGARICTAAGTRTCSSRASACPRAGPRSSRAATLAS